jgi:hypothetical protein
MQPGLHLVYEKPKWYRLHRPYKEQSMSFHPLMVPRSIGESQDDGDRRFWLDHVIPSLDDAGAS